jgi:hypothetical protein
LSDSATTQIAKVGASPGAAPPGGAGPYGNPKVKVLGGS